MGKIISRGAEALISLEKDSSLGKDRIKKSYRIPELDVKIRKRRTKKEIKLLKKAYKLIPTPKITKESEFKISMERISGEKLSENIKKIKNKASVFKQIGKNIAVLHDAGIIHGDLTTSNMIYSKNKVYFIDYGLGFESKRIEDKAVDLHVLREALESRHYDESKVSFNSVLEGYKKSAHSGRVIAHLRKVESRGRYKRNN